MITYQDLLKIEGDEGKRTQFVLSAIGAYESSEDYKT